MTPAARPHVGTLREKPLHAALKRWYRRKGDLVEAPVDGFVIDLVRDGLLIEIQTGGFSAMKRKLARLLADGHRVRIVYPVPVEKWIVKVDDAGEELSRRRSPKHGDVVDVFGELVSFPDLIGHPGLELAVLLTHEEEFRRHDEGRAWRRRGWVVEERRLRDVVGEVALRRPEDLAGLLPDGLEDGFTTADLASALARPRRLAQQMAYCLRRAGAITIDGKEGNALVYRASG